MVNILTMETSLKYDGCLLDRVDVVKQERRRLEGIRSWDLFIHWPVSYTAGELLRCTLGKTAADQTKWEVPAHQAMANLTAIIFSDSEKPVVTTLPSMGEVSPKQLRDFVMHYGPLTDAPVSPTSVDAPMSLTSSVDAPKVIIEDPTSVGLMQFALREAWRNEGMAKLLHERGEPAVLDSVSINARVVMKAQGVEIVVRNLWSFIRLSFLRDYHHGLTAICKLPSCPTPYFLQHGRRRMYCSHKCAMADSSRAYRERVRKETEAEVRKELKTKEEEM